MHSVEGKHQLKPSSATSDQIYITYITSYLSDHGIKPTRQRLAIAGHMFKKDQHLSADTILERVNNDASTTNVSKATVYNTLKLFVRKGILREVAVDPQRIMFDTNTHNHHHVLDLDTGDIRDIDPVDIDISKVAGLSIENVDTVDLVIKIRSDKINSQNS